MAFDFPSSPSVGQQFTPAGGPPYTWNGYAWTLSGGFSASGVQVNLLVFTTSGASTYFPSPGILYALVHCKGSGGGGGGAGGTSGNIYVGGGGGSGGYSMRRVTAAQVGASQTVTIGNFGAGGAAGNNNGLDGGDVSFGSLCIAKGGKGGGGCISGTLSVAGAGGSTTGAVGDLTFAGEAGKVGFYNSANNTILMTGGSGGVGFGGGGGLEASGTLPGGAGPNASNYGAGGAGGVAGPNNFGGGNGSLGVCWIIEFIGVASAGAATYPRGRLTLVSGQPVMTTDQTAKTRIYYTPYVGNTCPVANVNVTFAEVFLDLDATNATSGNVYDIFAFLDAGVFRIGYGPAWTTPSSTRSAAISMVNGLWVNSASITLRYDSTHTVTVPAGQAQYLGTFCATANGQTGMAFMPTTAAGGTNNFLALYNGYNQRRVTSLCRDNMNNVAYNTQAWAAFNSSNSDRVTWLDGLQQSAVDGVCSSLIADAGGGGAGVGMGLDGTTVTPQVHGRNGALANYLPVVANDRWQAQLGLHFIQMEWFGDAGAGAAFGGGTGGAFGGANTTAAYLRVSLEM